MGDYAGVYVACRIEVLTGWSHIAATFVFCGIYIPAPSEYNAKRKRRRMWERFTEKARRVIVLAQEEANRLGHNYVGTEHILLGLIKEKQNVAAKTLVSMGINLEVLRNHIESMVIKGDVAPSREKVFTRETKIVLELAYDETRYWKLDRISPEHILLGILRIDWGKAAEIFLQLGLNLENVSKQTAQLLGVEAPLRYVKHGLQPMSKFETWEYCMAMVKQVVQEAEADALKMRQSFVDVEHILLVLLEDSDIVKMILKGLEIEIVVLKNKIKTYLSELKPPYPEVGGLTKAAKKVLLRASQEALRWGRDGVNEQHLFLAVLQESETYATQTLQQMGVDIVRARAQTAMLLDIEQPDVATERKKAESLACPHCGKDIHEPPEKA